MAYIPRLKEEYKNRVISALKEEFGYKNVMQVPKLEKIVLQRRHICKLNQRRKTLPQLKFATLISCLLNPPENHLMSVIFF